MLSELDKMTEYFSVVTSNLRSKYLHTSQLVSQSFLKSNDNSVDETTQNILKAVNDLIEGEGKDNQGSLQRYFDSRDKELEKLSTEEIEDMKEWISVVLKKEQ